MHKISITLRLTVLAAVLLGGLGLFHTSPALAGPSAQETTPTPTPSVIVSGQPLLVIQSATTDPATPQPGQAFTLSLTLVNRGDYKATNIRISLASGQTLAIPQQSSSLWVLDQMPRQQTAHLDIPLVLSTTAAQGYQLLPLTLEYKDNSYGSFSSQQAVGLNVGQKPAATAPIIVLTAYATDPEQLSPGDTFTLHMTVDNVGKLAADQLLITLGGAEGASLKPFALLDSGNVKYAATLASQDTLEIEQRFIVDGAANSGVYNLPIKLDYDDADDGSSTTESKHHTETQVINLRISRRPQFQVSFYKPVAPIEVGQTATLPVEVVNIGRSQINVSTLEISAPDLDLSTSSAFIGALDAGTSGTLDSEATPRNTGNLPVTVTIHYLDDFNRPQEYTATLTVEVVQAQATPVPSETTPAQSPAPSDEGNEVVRFFKALFGLGS